LSQPKFTLLLKLLDTILDEFFVHINVVFYFQVKTKQKQKT